MSIDIERYASRKDTKKRFKKIYELIPENTTSILDIGCARYTSKTRSKNNLHELLVAETNATVHGIDISIDAVNEMQNDGYNVSVGDAENFNFNRKFDLIIAGEVIEYLSNPGQFVNNSLDHLSENGKIIITTENPYAFVYWRKSIQKRSQPNLIWIDPINISGMSDRISENNIEVSWISPDGGISSILWMLGCKQASAPRYCAVISK